LIECVRNGQRGESIGDVVSRWTGSRQRVPGVRMIEYSPDAVTSPIGFTSVGDGRHQSGGNGARRARKAEDDRSTNATGEHREIGAVEVIPLVPIRRVTVASAWDVPRRWRRFSRFAIPVYLYETASSIRPCKRLEDIRTRRIRGTRPKMASPRWAPGTTVRRCLTEQGATAGRAKQPLSLPHQIWRPTARCREAALGHRHSHQHWRACRLSRRWRQAGRPEAWCRVVHQSHDLRGDADLVASSPLSRKRRRRWRQIRTSEIVGLVPARRSPMCWS